GGNGGRMKDPRGWLAVLLPGALVPALAQADPPSAAFRQGTHVLRRIIYDLGIQPLATQQELQTNPRESVLIVLGAPGSFVKEDRGWLSRFVKDGGAVLFASDQQTPPNSDAGGALRDLAGVWIGGEIVTRAPEESRYLGVPECPFLEVGEGSLSEKLFT